MCIHHLSTSVLKSAERQSWTFFPEGLVVYVHANQWGAVGFVFVLQSSNKFQQVQKVMFRFLGVWKFILHSFRIVENSLFLALLVLLLLPIRSEGWKGGSGPRRTRGYSSSLLYVIAVTTRLKSYCLLYSRFQTARFFFLSMIITSVRDHLSFFLHFLHCIAMFTQKVDLDVCAYID